MAKIGSVIKCELCGKEFEVHFAAEKYCSRKCFQEASKIKIAEANYKRYEEQATGKIKERVCAWCGTPFYTKRKRVLCCSGACTRKHELEMKRSWYYENNEDKLGEAECIVCGKTFQKKKGNQVCCSPECSKERLEQLKKEIGNTNKTTNKRKKKPKPLVKIQEEMKKAGFDPRDYGKYMATQYMNEHNNRKMA